MSAIRGQADIPAGVRMSAYDPKQTSTSLSTRITRMYADATKETLRSKKIDPRYSVTGAGQEFLAMRGLLLLSIVGVALYAILLFADNALEKARRKTLSVKPSPATPLVARCVHGAATFLHW